MVNILGKPSGKHILFVDADPVSAAHLQTKLLVLHKDWNLKLVSSATEALTVMAGNAPDVLVTAFRLPQMDGIELLNTVKRFYPKTLRFIMSPASDRETVLKLAGATHPFLARPLDVQTLKMAIGRALTLRDAVDDQKMSSILADVKPVPTIPALYDKISRALNSDSNAVMNVAELISEDIGMSAKILQLVNSAFFGLRSRVENVSHAISLLGIATMKRLVLTAGVFEKFSAEEMKSFDVQELYTHSLEVGGLTHLAAEELHETRNLLDLAMVAGAMHDFGKIVLMRSDQNIYREVYRKSREEKRDIHEIEQQLLGVTHAEVGAYVLRKWGLSEIVVEAIALHHKPLRSHEQQPNILTAVHIANAWAHRTIVDGQESLPKLDLEYIRSLNLQDSVKSISKRFASMAKARKPS